MKSGNRQKDDVAAHIISIKHQRQVRLHENFSIIDYYYRVYPRMQHYETRQDDELQGLSTASPRIKDPQPPHHAS